MCLYRNEKKKSINEQKKIVAIEDFFDIVGMFLFSIYIHKFKHSGSYKTVKDSFLFSFYFYSRLLLHT